LLARLPFDTQYLDDFFYVAYSFSEQGVSPLLAQTNICRHFVEPFTLDGAEKTRLSIKNDSFDQKEIHAFVQFQIAQYHHSMPSTDSIPKMLACLSVQGYLFQKDNRLSIKRQANKEKRTMTTMFASYLSYLPNFTMAEPEILRNLAPCESTEQPNENKANSLPPISSWECSTR
jgi:hypothetical protein